MARQREPRDEDAPDPAERQRLDKWLVYARFARTRSMATDLVEGGRVRVNGQRVTNTSRLVGPGDVLTMALPHATKVVRILGAAERRGSFPDAQQLYEDLGSGNERT
ncbi:RNA-binding S4 domain-containing protein [uncultured Alsobacter sp.]|uniref:RNA-binding S4 domain-containing protein n=1 Tax=uncultured Alsobacter sp. TaxID=1748258 RepID=UPI0025E0B604|nr:RNA-binding S4 domain-containing protein [uncultured Alsobacter sp.]